MKILFTLALIISTSCLLAQSNSVIPAISKTMIHQSQNKPAGKDTVIEKDTTKENQEPRYFYLSVNTDVFVNTKGGFAKRFSPAVEFGRTYGIFDIGLATGRVNTLNSGGDTTHYIEFRPTINIFSKGSALELFGGMK